ncbi:hypothetical protein BOTBODRAFT_29134 [Botryobasidium botryosum FD-172 SS1]|uniref:Cyclin N-terminal domain-containing protein n=1 Tax=Botryobasidium botryosum (strain FD-172 SS1) TaxID=930990 RepID=A0A067N141_BOTB1|nr:hypothetical protein BOTBODRAFT_29134 [Botryobasidium botryosum FD-172 SS1]
MEHPSMNLPPTITNPVPPSFVHGHMHDCIAIPSFSLTIPTASRGPCTAPLRSPQCSPPTLPPSPTLAQFIAHSLHRTHLYSSVTFATLFLLNCLKRCFPATRSSSGHRLFISAFMIASKIICDDTYSNKSWCVVVQGMFSLREINQMEREMRVYLEWVLTVPKEELEVFEAERSPKTMLPPSSPLPYR